MKSLFKRFAAAAALGAALVSAPVHSAIVADILFVIDTSGSMGDDIAQVKARLAGFDGVMTSNGIDANYGLVRFGGANTLIQNLTTFSLFTAAGSPFSLLTANGGGTEDGSEAMRVGITGASWRADSVRNVILVTDENDDVATNRADLQAALDASLQKELINIIGNPNDDDGATPYYRALAPANGGAFFNILDFRADPGPFFTNFTTTKVNEIVSDFCTRFPTDPQCQNRVPEPGTLALLALALAGLGAASRRSRG